MNQNRDSFTSQLGIIMATVGSAVGLGNIWRFSYITGVNGGGAFLLVYILCVLLVGLPVMIAELTIGRSSGLSPVSAFKKMAPKSVWIVTGILSVIVPSLIMLYYPTVAGWSIGYVIESLFNWNNVTADTGAAFNTFVTSPKSIIYAALALLMATVVLIGGVSKGIEKSNKILMPTLGILLLILMVRSVTLPGAMEGVKFLFQPDFTKLTLTGVLDALGHSFFSLSLGMGIIITYASYMKKDTDLVNAAASIITMDTGIAILAGLAIFPTVFALGLNPGEGVGLAFITLPGAFAQMPFGSLLSAIFFLLLSIAALTSLMSILQVPLAFLEDEFKMSKKKSLVILTIIFLILGLPSVLSFSSLAEFKIFGMTYFDFLDKITNNLLLPLTGLLGVLFIVFRYGVNNSIAEFLQGSKRQNSILAKIYPVAVRFIAPVSIALILLNATGIFSLIIK